MEDGSPDALLRVLVELRDENGSEIVRIGHIQADSIQHWSDAVTLEVIVTRERRQHYLERHPEVVHDEPTLIAALLNPTEVHVNKNDSRIAIVYERLSVEFYLRVPIWISDRVDRQNSVLSMRRARLRELEKGRREGRQVWRK